MYWSALLGEVNVLGQYCVNDGLDQTTCAAAEELAKNLRDFYETYGKSYYPSSENQPDPSSIPNNVKKELVKLYTTARTFKEKLVEQSALTLKKATALPFAVNVFRELARECGRLGLISPAEQLDVESDIFGASVQYQGGKLSGETMRRSTKVRENVEEFVKKYSGRYLGANQRFSNPTWEQLGDEDAKDMTEKLRAIEFSAKIFESNLLTEEKDLVAGDADPIEKIASAELARLQNTQNSHNMPLNYNQLMNDFGNDVNNNNMMNYNGNGINMGVNNAFGNDVNNNNMMNYNGNGINMGVNNAFGNDVFNGNNNNMMNYNSNGIHMGMMPMMPNYNGNGIHMGMMPMMPMMPYNVFGNNPMANGFFSGNGNNNSMMNYNMAMNPNSMMNNINMGVNNAFDNGVFNGNMGVNNLFGNNPMVNK